MQTRYPGLSSFTTVQKDIFFGRKQETRDLTNLLAVERTVVLFSKSGYGKTSLLQAGVMPLLYSRQIVPVPIRFGTDALTPEQHFSIQFDTAWLKFSGKTEQEAQKLARDTSANESFWEQIRRCPFGEGNQQFTPLLIFDQFEELFTLYPDKEKRARFVAELANLVQERLPETLSQKLYERLERGEMTSSEVAAWETPPPMKFIFSIRSDMLHFMDELSEPMPYILRSRYQLFGLGEAQAREAIVAPAALGFSVGVTLSHPDTTLHFASQPFGYQEESLREILAVLSKNKEVESFQLQAVCQAIEEKVIRLGRRSLPARQGLAGGDEGDGQRQKFDPISLLPKEQGLPLITPDFYGGREGIDRILEDSYNRRLEELASIDETWPEIAHRLIEDGLVNKNGRRKSVDVVELIGKHRATPAMLDELERQRLVRKEPRLDSFYYEISHDTWLGPILKNRKIWEEAEERRMLEARAEAERVEKEKAIAARRRARLIALFGFLLAGLALVAAWFAILKSSEAERQTAEAVLQTIKADSLLVVAQNSKRLADEKAADAERNFRIAELEKKNALTAQEKAELQRLKAETEKKKAEAQLLASRLMAAHKLPDNFDALISLDTLDCSSWYLGSISSEIGKLQNLQSLNFYGNQLKSLPTEIWSLQNLQSLDLSGNQLASLPTEIGKLQNLQSLNFYGNQLTSLPTEIGKLQKLQSLYLSGNELTSLPAEIGNLQNLQSLDLQSNGLTSLPAEIGNLQNLQSLDLTANQLRSLPAEIGNLHNLQSLVLQFNQLTSLPAEIGNLQNLQSLGLERNQLTSLPAEIGKLQNLQSLDLQSNGLKSLPAEIGNLQNLQSLDLTANQLRSLPAEIGNLHNLQSLVLVSNQLTSLPAEIGKLQNLQSLKLQHNQLTSLPAEIGNLQNLQSLELKGNHLTSLPIEAFKKMGNLKKLALSQYAESNSLPKEQVKALRAAMPWCEVVWEE